MKMKKGFTIVELLIVIAIIGVLATMITTASIGAIRNAREKRADTMRIALEQAIAAYYAQEGKWPDPIETMAKNGIDTDTYTFTPDETDKIFYQVVGKGFGKSGRRSVLVDAMALFVANKHSLGNDKKGCYDNHANSRHRSTYCGGRGCINGVDFSIAVAKSGRYHIRLQDMAFGFQGPYNGKFCRYWVTYNAKADAVSVSREGPSL